MQQPSRNIVFTNLCFECIESESDCRHTSRTEAVAGGTCFGSPERGASGVRRPRHEPAGTGALLEHSSTSGRRCRLLNLSHLAGLFWHAGTSWLTERLAVNGCPRARRVRPAPTLHCLGRLFDVL
eukprot:1816899-Rhodomonas_salina.1